MERENIFDKEFCSKLKAFYSFDDGNRNEDIGYRRTGRTSILAKTLLETAIESGKELQIQDHYTDVNGVSNARYNMKREIDFLVKHYKNIGVDIDIRFHDRFDRFSAKLLGGLEEYKLTRTNPFPIKQLQERKEFLRKRILLLLL